MESDSRCPFCMQTLAEGAVQCASCGERVIGKACPDCRSICPDEARKCRWCGYEFKAATAPIDLDETHIMAARVPTLLLRFRLLRQRIHVNDEKLTVETPGVFFLWSNQSEVPWNKVAGFDYRSGIFWDSVVIETRGQQPTTIRCLAKEDGERLRDILRTLEV